VTAEKALPAQYRFDDSVAGRLLDLLVMTTDLGELLAGVTELAIEMVPGCESASVTVIHHRSPSTAAASDARALAVDESQYAGGPGPCLQAARTAQTVQVDDVATAATEEAWRRVAKGAAVTASLSLPLISSTNIEASLNLYSGRDDGWPAGALDQADALAAYAGNAITLAYRLNRREPENLYRWPYSS